MTRILQTTYRYRLEPNTEQEQVMVQFAGARRWVYNYGLARKKAHFKETGKGLSYNRLAAELTQLKQTEAYAWLRLVDSQLLQQALRDLETAFGNFFAKRAGFPKCKSRKKGDARFRIPQRVSVEGQFVKMPKIGLVRARIHRPLDGTSKGATFKREADGHWYVAIVIEQEAPERTNRTPQTHVGVDVGLKTYAVLSTGTEIANPRFFHVSARKRKRAQRVLSRRQKGSANRAKAKHTVARLHVQIGNKRNDFLHKLSQHLVNQFDLISIEDLSVRGLVKTKLAKSVSDAAWGMFRTMLVYKTDRHDGYMQKIGRFFASSKLCFACGFKNDALTLSDRTWTCSNCGILHDRDLNAAQNIDREGVRLFALSVAAGHAETLTACGQHVRPATAGGAG